MLVDKPRNFVDTEFNMTMKEGLKVSNEICNNVEAPATYAAAMDTDKHVH